MTTWQELREQESTKPYWATLQDKLAADRAAGHEIYPPEGEVYAALDLTPFDDVKVVILGQDPYHGPGEAHGLAFSVRPGVKVPPSLVNIYKEAASDVGLEAPGHGDLTSWAEQGVLLLNTALTVREGEAGSHASYWRKFTDELISQLGGREQKTVFILWGAHARKKRGFIADHHCILDSSHPSPLGARHSFWGSAPFSKANEFLRHHGMQEIDWDLPAA